MGNRKLMDTIHTFILARLLTYSHFSYIQWWEYGIWTAKWARSYGEYHLTTMLTVGDVVFQVEESHLIGKIGGLLNEEQFCRKTCRSPGGQVCNMPLWQIWPTTFVHVTTSQPPGGQNILRKGMFYYLPLSGLFYWYLFLTSKS